MLLLHVKAPFAAFRPFMAGSFRQTAPFVTPTAAYGLLLNLAGIESRRVNPSQPATDTALDLPACEVAVGMVREPGRGCLLQQLHNYPVGNTGKERVDDAHGAKYNIQPITRELLVDVEAVLALRGDDDFEERVRTGLKRGLLAPRRDGGLRYGVPFFGDNSFLVDVIEPLPSRACTELPAQWYGAIDKLPPHDGPRPGACRMTTWIDRNDMTRTTTALFAPTDTLTALPSEAAWVAITPPRGTPAVA